MNEKNFLLPQLYLAPLSYFSLIKGRQQILIEKHENMVKSTGRNRCYLAGPNGKLRLSIPLRGGKSQHTPYKDVQIDNEQKWEKNHWQSLCSCYRRSPYFEYYEDQFYPYYHTPVENLFEFNSRLFLFMLELLNWDIQVKFTEKYDKHPEDIIDLRQLKFTGANVSIKGKTIQHPKYHQVFMDRTGFLPNLSIVDLLFNNGPNTGRLIEAFH